MRKISFMVAALVGVLGAESAGALKLTELVEIGLEHNSSIKIADQNLVSVRRQRKSSYSGITPFIRTTLSSDLDPGQSVTLPDGVTIDPDRFASQISLSETIFDGAAAWYNITRGGNRVKAAEVELIKARQNVVKDILSSYYDFLSKTELLDVAREALELSRRQLELVEERYRLQAVRQTDLLKARVNVGQREIDVIRARQNRRIALTDLKTTIGLNPEVELEIGELDTVIIAPLKETETLKGVLLEKNPTLQAQGLAVEGSWLDARIQRGVLLPSVNINYSNNFSGSELGDAFKNGRSSTSLSVSLPLFTGYQNRSRYDRLRYAALIEEERLLDLERSLLAQLENILTQLQALHHTLPLNREILASAMADIRLANEQYNLGAISVLDLLDAQVSLIQAKSTLVRTTYDIKTMEAQLEALIGTL